MASTYLQVDFGKGKLFQYSKEEKEGFDKHESSTGKVSYRRYLDSVTGELVSLKVEKNENLRGAEELTISFKDESGDYINVTMMLLGQSGDYSNFAESLIKHLPYMIKGNKYFLSPYNFKNDKDRSVIGFSVRKENKDGDKLEKLSQSFIDKEGNVTEGDIPAVKWETKRGVNKPNKEAQQDYLYEILEVAKSKLEFNSTPKEPEQPKEEDKKKPKGKAKATTEPSGRSAVNELPEGDDDDESLPF